MIYRCNHCHPKSCVIVIEDYEDETWVYNEIISKYKCLITGKINFAFNWERKDVL